MNPLDIALVVLAVGLACGYLARRVAARFGRMRRPGCGGGCGCAQNLRESRPGRR